MASGKSINSVFFHPVNLYGSVQDAHGMELWLGIVLE